MKKFERYDTLGEMFVSFIINSFMLGFLIAVGVAVLYLMCFLIVAVYDLFGISPGRAIAVIIIALSLVGGAVKTIVD